MVRAIFPKIVSGRLNSYAGHAQVSPRANFSSMLAAPYSEISIAWRSAPQRAFLEICIALRIGYIVNILMA